MDMDLAKRGGEEWVSKFCPVKGSSPESRWRAAQSRLAGDPEVATHASADMFRVCVGGGERTPCPAGHRGVGLFLWVSAAAPQWASTEA